MIVIGTQRIDLPPPFLCLPAVNQFIAFRIAPFPPVSTALHIHPFLPLWLTCIPCGGGGGLEKAVIKCAGLTQGQIPAATSIPTKMCTTVWANLWWGKWWCGGEERIGMECGQCADANGWHWHTSWVPKWQDKPMGAYENAQGQMGEWKKQEKRFGCIWHFVYRPRIGILAKIDKLAP